MTSKALAANAILILSVIMFSSCIPPSSGPSGQVEIGRPAPNFKLLDLRGQEVTLDQFEGKIVLLDFWATWCGPCRMVMPLLERLEKEYSDIMVQLAVNIQEPKDMIEDYVQNQGIHSLVLMDKEGSVSQTYGAVAIPTQILIDRDGVVRYIQEGFSPAAGLSRLRAEIEKLR